MKFVIAAMLALLVGCSDVIPGTVALWAMQRCQEHGGLETVSKLGLAGEIVARCADGTRLERPQR